MDQADRSVQSDTQNVASTRCSSSRQTKCWPLKNLTDSALLVKRCSSFGSPVTTFHSDFRDIGQVRCNMALTFDSELQPQFGHHFLCVFPLLSPRSQAHLPHAPPQMLPLGVVHLQHRPRCEKLNLCCMDLGHIQFP